MVKTTSSVVLVQTPLLIVQRKVTLKPAVKPVTPLTLEVGVVIDAPLAAPMILQVPEPVVGALPAKVNDPILHFS